jgi:hypothetical protein
MFAAKRGVLRLWPEGSLALGSPTGWLATGVFAAVSLAVSWAVASLSWRWLEQAFGRALRQRLGQFRPAPPGLPA